MEDGGGSGVCCRPFFSGWPRIEVQRTVQRHRSLGFGAYHFLVVRKVPLVKTAVKVAL